MTIKLYLLKERVEYIVAEFGNKVKISDDVTDKEFSVVEMDLKGDSFEALKLFHAGFQCGYEFSKKQASDLV